MVCVAFENLCDTTAMVCVKKSGTVILKKRSSPIKIQSLHVVLQGELLVNYQEFSVRSTTSINHGRGCCISYQLVAQETTSNCVIQQVDCSAL